MGYMSTSGSINLSPTLDVGYDPLSDANLQLFKEIWILAGYVKINDKLIDPEVDMYPIKTIHHFQYQIRNLIYLTPSYAREAKKKARDNQGRLLRDAREQAMAPTLDVGYDPLSDANL